MRLYYGTVSPETTAFQGDVAAWRELNVDVINVYSNGEDYYVQDAFAEVRTHGPYGCSASVLYLVGKKFRNPEL